jgi:4a-hydroxytetrahydrobiopterin dehydratase
MSTLATEQCEEKVAKLSDDEAAGLLRELQGWTIEDGVLRKLYSFKGYFATISFVNLVAFVANRQNHHPDVLMSYNKCRVDFSTHSVGGLSRNDFICAARIDAAQV